MPGIAMLFAIALAGCGSKAPESKLPVKEYVMRGEVLKLDPANQLATIKHEEIKGWMGAMTMDYAVRDKPEFAKLRNGAHFTATVYVQGDDFWVGKIEPAKPVPTK